MRTKTLKINKIIRMSFLASAVLFVLSVGFKLYLCGSLAVKNNDLEQAFLQKQKLSEDISKLTYIDSKLSSISSVEERAKQLGFVEMTSRILSLNPDVPAQVAALNQ